MTSGLEKSDSGILLNPHFTDRRFSGDHGVYGASPKRHEARQKRLGMSDFAVLGNAPRFLHAGITVREDFAALIVRSLCVSIAFVSRFLYDLAD